MKLKSIYFLILLGVIVTTSSCKFYFNESEYLGTYYGSLTSYYGTYIPCDAQMIITDAGDNVVNIEFITDSNGTFYYNNLSVERGYSLGSDNLRIGGYGVHSGGVNRRTHSIYFSEEGGSYYNYYFYGNRL